MRNPYENHRISFPLHKYRQTGNPLYIWEAYQAARQSDGPMPKEILTYLDGVAIELLTIAENPPPRRGPDAVQEALGLSKNGAGQGSKFAEFQKNAENLDGWKMAVDTYWCCQRWGEGKTDYAFDEIGKQYGVGKSAVRRNYKKNLDKWTADARQFNEGRTVKIKGAGTVQQDGKTVNIFGRELTEIDIIESIAKTIKKSEG